MAKNFEKEEKERIVPLEVMQRVYKRKLLFQFRVREGEMECIHKKAKRNKISASEYVRNLVMRDCEK